jgi:hypothetical protein
VTHLQKSNRPANVHFVVLERDLSAFADRLEGSEVDDRPDTTLAGVLGEDFIDGG